MRTRFLLLTLLVLLLSFSLASAINYTDTLFYYSFDDTNVSSGNPLDLSINNRDGTNNGATTGVTGILDQAFDFDGSTDYVNTPSFGTTGKEITVSYWFSPDAASPANDWIARKGTYNTLSDRVFNIGYPAANILRHEYFDSSGNQVGLDYTTSTSVGSWYHVVVFFNNSDSSNPVRLWFNGVEVTGSGTPFGTANTANNIRTSNTIVNIGRMRSSLTREFDGKIDEFTIYDFGIGQTGVDYLYNSGSGRNPYTAASSFTHNITGLYLSPNTSVYTDESDLRGYVTLNTTTGVYGINYTYMVNGADITSDQYIGSPSGSQYTLPVFSNSNFQQEDNVSFKAFAVNSTGAALSEERTSGIVTITNRVPTGSLTWSTLNPLNDTNFTGYVTPGDSDLDTINISWTLYKNGAVSTSGSSNNNAYPYGTIALFTVDSATTNVNDTYTFNVSIYDGFDYYLSSASANATVTASENFTVTLNDEWSGIPITDYNISVGLFDSFNVCSNSSGIGSCQTMNESYFNNSYSIVRGVTGLSGSTVFSVYNYDTSTYNGISISTGLPATPYINFLGTNYSYYSSSSSTVGSTTTAYYYFNVTKTFVSNTTTYITNIISNSTTSVTLSANNYFSRTYSDWNLSENLAAELHQSEYSFNAYEYLSGDLLSGVTFTISGNSYDQFNLTAGNYTVTASKSGYYNKTYNFTATALAQETLNITKMYNAIINLSVVDALTGNPINFSGYAYNIAEDYYDNFSDATQYTTVNAIDGSYQFYLWADDYVINGSNTFSQAITSGVNLVELSLYPAKTVIFTFYDEVNGGLLNNITIDLVFAGTSSGYNGSTSNGTYQFDGLAADSYILEYSSTGYINRYYPFTLTSNDFYNITLYMVSNTSGTSPITIEVIDEQYADVPGAIVKALKYDVSSGNYIQVTSGATDDQGELVLNLFKNDGFYKFVVVYDGVTVKTTAPSTIINDNILIPISISSALFTEFFTYLNYEYTLDFNSVSNNFRFTYNDVTNAISTQACLRVYKVLSTGAESQINSSCSSSTAATLLTGITPVNGTTYIARAYYDTTLVATLVQEYVSSPNLGVNGWFLQLLIMIAFSVAAVFSIELLPISAVASLIVGRAVGLTVLPWSVIAGLMVVAITVSFIINRNKG